MSLFAERDGDQPAAAGGPDAPATSLRPPPRWSVLNWPVRWKVLITLLVPLVAAAVFAGLYIGGEFGAANRLCQAAERAETIPKITAYLSALDGALLSASAGGDVPSATKRYEHRKSEIDEQLGGGLLPEGLRTRLGALLDGGQQLLDRVLADRIEVRDQVRAYLPLLLTAQDAITASVRTDDDRILTEAENLRRAVAGRGQMTRIGLLVNRGGELPDPQLRNALMALAGADPAVRPAGSAEGGGADADKLRQQAAARLAVIADPQTVLPNNPALRDAVHGTGEIVSRVIEDTGRSLLAGLREQADHRRAAAVRAAALTLAGLLVALAAGWLLARTVVRALRALPDSTLAGARTDRAGAEREPAPLPVTSETVSRRNRSPADHQSADADQPESLPALIDAAIAGADAHQRVRTGGVAEVVVSGTAAVDIVQVLTEFLDNALRYSPPATTVRVSAVTTPDTGVLIRTVDAGPGMTEPDLRTANTWLAADSAPVPDHVRRMGLFVAGRLAARHHIAARLAAVPGGGISAEVQLPPGLLVSVPGADRVPAAAERLEDRNRPAVAAAATEQPATMEAGAGQEDLIYEWMRAQLPHDPHELGRSADLDWRSVWDHGWSTAGRSTAGENS